MVIEGIGSGGSNLSSQGYLIGKIQLLLLQFMDYEVSFGDKEMRN